MLLGQEDHADTVLARRRQLDALRGQLGAVVLVGDLDQDARAVAHQLVGTDRAAVVEVLEDLEALRDDVVRALATDMRDEAYPAGVALVPGHVQPRLRGLRARAALVLGGGVGAGGVHGVDRAHDGLRAVHGLAGAQA